MNWIHELYRDKLHHWHTDIMNPLWVLSDKDTAIRSCWVTSYCGIKGTERVNQLAKETIDHDKYPLTRFHYADLTPFVSSHIQQLVQIKWDVSIHSRDRYLLKPTIGPPKKFQYLTRAGEVILTRLWICHTNSHNLFRKPPTTCHHCDQTPTIDNVLLIGMHITLENAVLQETRDE